MGELRHLIKTLRANALSDLDAFVVASALLAWAKLSSRGQLSSVGSIGRILEGNLHLLSDTLLHAAQEADGLLSDLVALQGMEHGVVQRLLGIANDSALAGRLDQLPAVALAPHPAGAPIAIPANVVSLMVALSGVAHDELVYAPWDFYAQLANAAHGLGAVTAIETPIHSNVPRLLQVLADAPLSVRYADPITSPLARNTDGSLQQFDVSLSFPPVGLRYERHVSERDSWARFAEHTTSGAVLAVRHLLAQTKRRVVALMPNSLLSNSGAERALRHDLVARGVVEAVIGLPKGLFESTGVATALLVLNPQAGNNRVRFLDVEGSQFFRPISKTRWELVQPELLSELALREQPTDLCTASVPQADVLSNDASLQVNRYVANRKFPHPRHISSSNQIAALGTLVRTIRPLPPTTRKDLPTSVQASALYEVGAADLPQHGYIMSVERKIRVDSTTLSLANQLLLKPMDIVLIVKGSVGRIGILPPKLPTRPGRWVVGQSGIVLRVTEPNTIDPRVLFLFLRSQIGQLQLRCIVAGSTTPLIQLRELLALELEIPTAEEQMKAAIALEAERQIQEQIDQLRVLQAKAASHLWSVENA